MEAAKKNNSFWSDMLRPVVVLVVICLVSSALLGLTNAQTAPVIEENERIAAEQAMREALPEASSFEALPVNDELAAKGVTGIYQGNDGTGYVITAANKGYGGDVTVTVGFDAAGAILHVSANVASETQGVGSKLGERDMLDRFNGLTGNANDVVLRAGATYTSNAVRNGVNAALEAVASVIG